MTWPRKINYESPTIWSHHRSGWRLAANALRELHDPTGIKFFDWADALFRDNKVVEEPWIGIIHNVINYPSHEYKHKYGHGIYCLSTLKSCPVWSQNLKRCRGLFTLSNYTADYLRNLCDIMVVPVIHPTTEVKQKFDFELFMRDPKVITLGQWMRRYQSIYRLNTTWPKIVVKSGNGWEADYQEMIRRGGKMSAVKILDYLPNDQYDKMLTSSVIFLDLYDCAACNVILECVIRNTPILINKLPTIEEYIGSDYPLFYNNLEEAATLLNEKSLLAATEYLKHKDKTIFSSEYFRDSIASSAIYMRLGPRRGVSML